MDWGQGGVADRATGIRIGDGIHNTRKVVGQWAGGTVRVSALIRRWKYGEQVYIPELVQRAFPRACRCYGADRIPL
ncbi:hypothetical protein T07_1881 [Trichinella nelsoni]|uniref:Uncharacterized protein n=1 Tax=Trichinella nelsoni TaxID=6336 RepID=A0A0V0RCT0_9BILA|nr:hypothetical protein T07_1881 [Trichinella nelsoni]